MIKEYYIVLKKKQTCQKKKKIKLEHKLISVRISNKHPEIDIVDHEIQRFVSIEAVLIVFNLLIEAESDLLKIVKIVKTEYQIFV